MRTSAARSGSPPRRRSPTEDSPSSSCPSRQRSIACSPVGRSPRRRRGSRCSRSSPTSPRRRRCGGAGGAGRPRRTCSSACRCSAFLYLRFDLVAVALSIWSLALLRRRREEPAGALLGLAIMAKLWPIALVPLFAFRRARRGLLVGVAVCLVLGAWWYLSGGAKGPFQVLSFRDTRGWHVESVVGSILWVLRGVRVPRGRCRSDRRRRPVGEGRAVRRSGRDPGGRVAARGTGSA